MTEYIELSPRVYLRLRTGADLSLLDSSYGRDRIDMDTLRAFWSDAREAILAEWIREHPGSRPWGWWTFDSPEPRRVISGIESPESGFTPWASGPRQYWFGVPTPKNGNDTAEYEDELTYLRRHRLLTPSERRLDDAGELIE